MIQEKAPLEHSHSFLGSIEDARKLYGISYEKYMRNDLKDQIIQSKHNTVSVGVESNNSIMRMIAGNNKNYLIAENNNLNTNNLLITGYNNEDVVVNINGSLLIKGQPISGSSPSSSTPSTPSVINNITTNAPIGSIIQMISQSVPDGYIEANGNDLLRSEYNDLYEFAKTKTDILSDTEWLNKRTEDENVEYYSHGDGVTTFRVPNLVSGNKMRYFIKY